jgi:hypothetical protein
MTAPLVSYIVPFYNACSRGRSADWLLACIESLLAQRYSNLEFIFVNDGSSDRSVDIVRAVARGDVRVRMSGYEVSEHDHRGLIWALNEGLRLAQGEFIARLDSDDFSPLDRTEKQIAFFDSRPDIHILGGAMEAFEWEPGGHKIMVPPYATEYEAVRRVAKGKCPFFHPSVMFRRLIYDQLGGYPEGYVHAEDYAYWVRVLRVFRGANLPDVLLHHRNHPNKVSTQYYATQCATARRVAAEAAELPEQSPFDRLLGAYCKVRGIYEAQLRRSHHVEVEANAVRWRQWRNENPHPGTPLANFYVEHPEYFDELAMWQTQKMWDGHWRRLSVLRGDVLDFGGGLGLPALMIQGRYHHYDCSPVCRDVVRAHSPNAVILESIEDGAQFDHVLCTDVLEHVEETDALTLAMRLASMVKPGGTLMLTTNFGTTDLHPMHCGNAGTAANVDAALKDGGCVKSEAFVYRKAAP